SAEPATNLNATPKKATHPFLRTMKELYRNFKKNKSALVGAYLIIALTLLAVLGPILIPLDIKATDYTIKLQGPSLEHLLGTDPHGRDIFKRIVHGLGITMSMGILATILGGFVGVVIGIISGYYGGIIDAIIMRIMDVLLAFPGILLALALVSILGANIQNVVYAVAISAIPTFARIVRGSTLETKNLE